VINLFIALIIVCLTSLHAIAGPGQTGSSGLLNVSSAETAGAGNVCIGLWPCYSENRNLSHKSALTVPVSLTIGLGSLWEVYGAYPNILFNGDNDASGRGTLDLGTKFRILDSRTSAFRLSLDFLGQRHVSANSILDGVSDLSAKLVSTYKPNDFGLHVSAGFLKPGSVSGLTLQSEYVFGAGVEYMVKPRIKLLGEVTAATNRYFIEEQKSRPAPRVVSDYSAEAFVGAQYFLFPHLTLNTSLGTGFGPNDPEIRFLFGISSCMGVGENFKRVPPRGTNSTESEKTGAPVKQLDASADSTRLLNTSASQTAPASGFETGLDNNSQEVVIKPCGLISVAPQQASSNLISIAYPDNNMSSMARDDVNALQPLFAEKSESCAIDFTLSRVRGLTPILGVIIKGSASYHSSAPMVSERLAVSRKFRFPDEMFEYDQLTLSNNGKKMLSEMAEQTRRDKSWSGMLIDGHTDSSGSLMYNMDLTLKRAISVASYLISHEGVSPAKIFIEGLGKTLPIADNGSAAGRRLNRRTEILFLGLREAR